MNYEKLLRAIRRHPALWGDLGPAKEAQAERLRDMVKSRLEPVWQARHDAVMYKRGLALLQTWA